MFRLYANGHMNSICSNFHHLQKRNLLNYHTRIVALSCLLPQADEKIMQRVLKDEDELNSRVYQFPTSAIKQNGRKINYYDFLMATENSECNEAIVRMAPKINMDQITVFIDKVPYISQLQKEFYKKYISARYEKIILPAYELAMRQYEQENYSQNEMHLF